MIKLFTFEFGDENLLQLELNKLETSGFYVFDIKLCDDIKKHGFKKWYIFTRTQK